MGTTIIDSLTSSDVTLKYHDANTIAANKTSSIDITNERTTAIVLSVFLLVCSTYLLVSLSYFQYWVPLKFFSPTKTSIKEWCDILCLMAAVFAFLNIIFEIVEIFTGEFSSSICVWIRHIKVVFLCAACGGSYSVLWLRQWELYRNPALHHLSNKLVRFCSAGSIFIGLIGGVTVPILHGTVRTYTSSEIGCVLVWTNFPQIFFEVCYYVVVVLAQTFLVGLFNYPLLQLGKSFLRGNMEKLQTIKRSRWAAVVAWVSTVTMGLLSLVPGVSKYYLLGSVLIDFDIMITLLSVIISFRDWKTKLLHVWLEENESAESGSGVVSANRTETISKV